MVKYNNYSKKFKQEAFEEPVEMIEAEPVEIIEAEPVEVESVIEPKVGIVTDCFKLNVREAPSIESDVVCVLNLATEVRVYEDESTEDFYKISTATSKEGYCMKKFIAI